MRNTKDLRDKINMLMNDQELRLSLSEKGYKLYLKKYTTQKYAERILECLRN